LSSASVTSAAVSFDIGGGKGGGGDTSAAVSFNIGGGGDGGGDGGGMFEGNAHAAVSTYAPVCALHVRVPVSTYPSLHFGVQLDPGSRDPVQSPMSPFSGSEDASHELDEHIAGEVVKHAPVSEHRTQHSLVSSNTEFISASSQQYFSPHLPDAQ
jgi:hypothetical protein